MPKVTPMRVSPLELERAGYLYLRSHRTGAMMLTNYRKAADALHDKVKEMGLTKMAEANDRQRRSLYVWIVENTRMEPEPQ